MSEDCHSSEPETPKAYSEAVLRFIRAMQALDIEKYGETVGPGANEINLLEKMWHLPTRGET